MDNMQRIELDLEPLYAPHEWQGKEPLPQLTEVQHRLLDEAGIRRA